MNYKFILTLSSPFNADSAILFSSDFQGYHQEHKHMHTFPVQPPDSLLQHICHHTHDIHYTMFN